MGITAIYVHRKEINHSFFMCFLINMDLRGGSMQPLSTYIQQNCSSVSEKQSLLKAKQIADFIVYDKYALHVQ